MRHNFRKFVRESRGATAIEYGLIVALVVIVAVVGISALGGGNGGLWGNFTTKIANAEP